MKTKFPTTPDSIPRNVDFLKNVPPFVIVGANVPKTIYIYIYDTYIRLCCQTSHCTLRLQVGLQTYRGNTAYIHTYRCAIVSTTSVKQQKKLLPQPSPSVQYMVEISCSRTKKHCCAYLLLFGICLASPPPSSSRAGPLAYCPSCSGVPGRVEAPPQT